MQGDLNLSEKNTGSFNRSVWLIEVSGKELLGDCIQNGERTLVHFNVMLY